jgi:DNA-binding response OmpR family regulator
MSNKSDDCVAIVDDDQTHIESLKLIFRAARINFVCYDNAEQFVFDLLNTNLLDRINVLLLDLNMPFDGREVIATIRRSFHNHPLQIIIYSAFLDHNIKEELIDLGVDDYFEKGIEIEDLLNKLKSRFKTYHKLAGANQNKTVAQINSTVAIDYAQLKVLIDNQDIGLTSGEFELISFLAQKSPNYVSAKTINFNIFGYPDRQDSNNFRALISHINNKFAKANPNFAGVIKSIRNKGYVFTLSGD